MFFPGRLRRKTVKRTVSLLILAALLAGCAVTSTPTPVVSVPTQAPTWTPQPTYTPNPTYTPFPTPTVLPPTATPAPTFTPAPTATPTPVMYLVKPGDMLNSLARQFSVAPEAIIAANNITNPNILEVGAMLVIPLTVTAELSATAPISVTPKPVAVRPVAPVALPARPAPANFIYPRPQILYPANGTTLKYESKEKKGGVESIVFSWLPVGKLLSVEDQQSCRWEGQPNGTTGYLVDRYQIEFDPPLWNDKMRRFYAVFHNDHGVNREFNLLEFQPNVSYTWRVAVGRWCVLVNYDNQDPKHNVMLQLASPYTELRTFMYTH
jgi:LysM repeat protein